MMNIQLELRNLGYDYACKEIVHLFITQYEICDPVTKVFPKTYDDVLKIIENPLWYNKNKMKSRNIVWMVTYGIFRQNMDRWLQQVANAWSTSKKNYRISHNIVQNRKWICATEFITNCIYVNTTTYQKYHVG